MTGPESSGRLVDQRIRNRIMEVVEDLADGADGMRAAGGSDWFENFFDWVLEANDVDRVTTLTPEERDQLKALWHLMAQACTETRLLVQSDELIATGWPDRIAPVARDTLETLARRGRHLEEAEENESSQA